MHLPPDTTPARSPPPEGEVQSAAVGLSVFGVPLMNCIHHVGLFTLATPGFVMWLSHLFWATQNHIAPAEVMMLEVFCSDTRIPWPLWTVTTTSSPSSAAA